MAEENEGRMCFKEAVGGVDAGILRFAGQQLGDISNVKDIFSGKVLLAFILLAGLALTPVILDKAKRFSNK